MKKSTIIIVDQRRKTDTANQANSLTTRTRAYVDQTMRPSGDLKNTPQNTRDNGNKN